MRATFIQCWVRKLTGKPVDITPPDCGFETRRIHHETSRYEAGLSFWAKEINALRIQVVGNFELLSMSYAVVILPSQSPPDGTEAC